MRACTRERVPRCSLRARGGSSPCSPCRVEGVGTKGVPPQRRPKRPCRAGRRTKGRQEGGGESWLLPLAASRVSLPCAVLGWQSVARTNGRTYGRPAGQREQAEGRHIAGEWLTYQQTGERLGISSEAARQRARRLRWRHQRGNDGRTLVQLPEGEEPSAPVHQTVQTGVQPPVQPTVQPVGEAVVLRELVDVLRTQLAKAETRADEDRVQLRVERERSAAAERQVTKLRALVDNELTELRTQMNQARMTLRDPGAVVPPMTRARLPLTQWLLRFLVQRRHPGSRRS